MHVESNSGAYEKVVYHWKPSKGPTLPRAMDVINEIVATRPGMLTEWILWGETFACYRSSETQYMAIHMTREDKRVTVSGYPLIKDIPETVRRFSNKDTIILDRDMPICPIAPLTLHNSQMRVECDDPETELILVGVNVEPEIRERRRKIEITGDNCSRGWRFDESPFVYHGGTVSLPYHAFYPDDLRERWTGVSVRRKLEKRKMDDKE